jgi:hypothetical protein
VQVGAGGSSFAAITQHVGICTDDERYGSLLELLEAEYSAGKFLVLTSSVDRCQQLYRQLTKVCCWGCAWQLFSLAAAAALW